MTLPPVFETYFRQRWAREDVDQLIHGLHAEPSTSIRLNPRCFTNEVEPEGSDGHVSWCKEGVYLKGRPTFTADPLLHAGTYYVQEASSMFIAHVVRMLGITAHAALDLCAAPGGKSTLLRALLPAECQLVSNEPVRQRAQVLAENVAKWGYPNVVVTQAYANELAHWRQDFDLILTDVPCSGEGMMRKEEEAVRQWSPAFVSQCAELQRSIVKDIWPALRPGGILIYSTCTFNPEEDEDNAEWIARHLGADILPVPVDPSWGILGDLRADKKGKTPPHLFAHFLPGRVRGEGFFCAVLRKHGEVDSQEKVEVRTSTPKPAKANGQHKNRKGSLAPPVTILPTDVLDAPDAPCVELSIDDAIRYLRREALILPPSTPRGIVLACYRGQRLGPLKNLGTRANNLYPKEWRIRSTYTIPHTLFPED
ncbi:MAG: hypothetical protein K6A32_06235 [Bacteroidales bacterium]|nr:hypothetical protein [Bacteroidales bacterium]